MLKKNIAFIILALLIAALFALNLFGGSIAIPASDVLDILTGGEGQKESWRYIVLESRLPQAITALLCGAALAASGLLLQTAFRNPLADPSIFGISSGAGLGVALTMLLFGGSLSLGSLHLGGFVAVILAAFVGAMLVTAIIFFFSTMVRNHVMLLIIGIMIGYLSASAITLLNFFATVTIAGIVGTLLLIKPLNALMLGDRYAENLGFSIRRIRNWLLVVTGILTAITTAFCGPVSFIGLAVPHIARLIFRTDNHRLLLPATLLCGAAVALLCNIVCYLPGESGIIPLGAVTPLMGAPVIIYILVRGKRI